MKESGMTSKIRIVVVEDESIIAMELRDRLRKLGYEVPAVVSSGEEAIQKTCELNPDLVMMDIMLEGKIDGVEATKQIHQQFDIPVVYLTAYSDDSTLERAKLTEPYGYVLKPFDERELFTTVEIALYKYKMEKKLKDNERWLSTTLKSIGDAVITTDMDGNVTFINPKAEVLTGWKGADAVGKSLDAIFCIMDDKSRKTLDNHVLQVLKRQVNGKSIEHCVLVNKHHKEIDISENTSPIIDDKGDVQGVVLTFQDISERMCFERALRESEERFRSVVENSHTGIVVVNTHFKCIYANREMTQLLGYSEKEILDRDFRIFLSDYEKNIFAEHKIQLEQGEKVPSRYDFEILRKNGEKRQMQVVVSTVNMTGGESQTVIQLLDVTERNRLEQQLRHAQKMKAIGTLAGGIAHDFNNIITAIRGCTDLVISQTVESDPIYQDLKEVQISAERASELTRQLLYFSRNQPMEMVTLNLNKTIEGLFKMLHRLIGEDVGISTALAPELWHAYADKGSFEEVIMNLAINARDAMPKGGKLTIKTENVVVDKIYCENTPEGRPGKFVCVSIEDSGIGMDAETSERIFEPFFSTKGPGKGSGLGLAVVYGIVKQHDGWINVYSELGYGTTFKIYLPISTGKEDKIEEKIDPEIFKGKGERILVVEDEKRVRDLARKVLIKHGYQVFTAESLKQAKSIYSREKGKFELLFSDVVLPDGDGIQLSEELTRKDKQIKIILSSGYTDKKSQWEIIKKKGIRFLQKPYSLITLLQIIRESLDQNKKAEKQVQPKPA
jgi:two-component system cell cycle sensor histidine kinase/response regulator CckA